MIASALEAGLARIGSAGCKSLLSRMLERISLYALASHKGGSLRDHLHEHLALSITKCRVVLLFDFEGDDSVSRASVDALRDSRNIRLHPFATRPEDTLI